MQKFQSLLGLVQAAATFETERHRGQHDDERAGTLGDLRDDGRRARSSATTETGADENNLVPLNGLTDLLLGIQRGLTTEIRITTSADAFHEVAAELHFVRCHAVTQHAHIGVKTDEVCIHGPVQRDAVQNIGSRAANSRDTDFQFRLLGGVVLLGAVVFDHGGVVVWWCGGGSVCCCAAAILSRGCL